MPTPVSVARQCLTPESSHAVDEAVAVARRRGHAQTTSLHAVSALLNLPSSALRDACARARNAAYSSRLQFKALELCLSVSLDRVPSGQTGDEPPVSNSLMAAIKRSQANQRRQPENFHLYHQLSQQSSSSVSCVKVELQHLILSILDDPVVSRVFDEAGFRSTEIKLAIMRPLPQLFNYSRVRAPPLFLCNLRETDPGFGAGSDIRSFSFPFSGGFGGFWDGDENCRRIGEVMGRSKGRNPLLVGICSYDAFRNFKEIVEKRKEGVLPKELSGLNLICIENEISKFLTENFDKGSVNLKFEELSEKVKRCLGSGVVLNYGDLKAFVGENSLGEAVSFVVGQLTRLLEVHVGKVRLIGVAASYETYLKFVSRFPTVEKDWDLQLLPITSLRPNSMAASQPKSSLMESFVPFGGFFSTPSALKGPLNGSYEHVPRCHLCNEKCEQEIIAVSEEGFTPSVADHYQSSLPSWLQMAELSTNKGLDMKTKDDGMVLSAKVIALQKKWDNICQRLHHSQPYPEPMIHQAGSQFPTVVGFQFVENKTGNDDKHSRNKTNASPNENKCDSVNPCMPMDLQKNFISQSGLHFPLVSKGNGESVLTKVGEKSSKAEDLELAIVRSPCSLSDSSVGDGNRTSPTSATSVTTDLGLGIYSAPASNELKKSMNPNQKEIQPDLSGCFSANVDSVDGSSIHPAQSSSCSGPEFLGQFDARDLKVLSKALTERVGWQCEAISVISKTIARCQTRNHKCRGASPKGNLWFNFTGPDRSGKRKIAILLAETLYGSRENFISVDLSSPNGMILPNTNFDGQELTDYNVKVRGKTEVDYVAAELVKKPLSIVFVENIDKADTLAQNSLSRAIRAGKFSDPHGKEVSINNAIFVTTSTFGRDSKCLPHKDSSTYSEAGVLRAKGWPIKILIEHARWDVSVSANLTVPVAMRRSISSPIFMNKRKMLSTGGTLEQLESIELTKRAHKASTRYLDLNLPAEENEVQDTDDGNSNYEPVSENSEVWLQDFFEQVDETVDFKPFDFDALAEKVWKDIKENFQKIVGLECLLEIESLVMEQLLAVAYLSDKSRVVEDWVEQVLSRGFAEVQKRYNLHAHSVVKIVSCQGLYLEQQAPGVFLPPRISLN